MTTVVSAEPFEQQKKRKGWWPKGFYEARAEYQAEERRKRASLVSAELPETFIIPIRSVA